MRGKPASSRAKIAAAAVATRGRSARDGGLLAEFDARLPFELTAGQQQVSAEILGEMARPTPMQRLLQGEVGSGKTVVALRAMLAAVDAASGPDALDAVRVHALGKQGVTDAVLADLPGHIELHSA